MAVAALVCSLAVCTMTGCTGKATEQEAAQAVSTENATEGTILTAEDIKASGQNASASADVDEVTDHPAGEKTQEEAEDSVPESGTTEEAPKTEPKQEAEVSVDKETSGNKTSGSSQGSTQSSAGSAPSEKPQTTATQAQSGSTSSTPAAPAETAPSLPAVQEQTTVQVPVENQQSQTQKPQTETCTHNWQPVTHEETVCTQPEYYEQITEERIIARDGTDITEFYGTAYYDEDGGWHDPFMGALLDHGGSYSCKQVVVETIHHDAVYVTETVTDYYKCTGCGNIITVYEYEHPETIPNFVSFN